MTRPGDIVLVDYPFTDRPASKRRPVLVLAERPDYKGEFLVVFISSRGELYDPDWDVLLDPSQSRDAKTRLRTVSVLKTTKVTIISGASMAGRLGVADESVMGAVRERLGQWLGGTTP